MDYSSIVAYYFEAHLWVVYQKVSSKTNRDNIHIVKGTPFSFRILVKYKVPEPGGDA